VLIRRTGYYRALARAGLWVRHLRRGAANRTLALTGFGVLDLRRGAALDGNAALYGVARLARTARSSGGRTRRATSADGHKGAISSLLADTPIGYASAVLVADLALGRVGIAVTALTTIAYLARAADGNAGATFAAFAGITITALAAIARLARAATRLAAGLRVRDGNAGAVLAGLALVAVATLAAIARLARAATRLAAVCPAFRAFLDAGTVPTHQSSAGAIIPTIRTVIGSV
jgi:hypothetical protein